MKSLWMVSCLVILSACGMEVQESSNDSNRGESRNKLALMIDDHRQIQVRSDELKCRRGQDYFEISFTDREGQADSLMFDMFLDEPIYSGWTHLLNTNRSPYTVSIGLGSHTLVNRRWYALERLTVNEQPNLFAKLVFTEVSDYKVVGQLWVEGLYPTSEPLSPSMSSDIGIRSSFTCVRFD